MKTVELLPEYDQSNGWNEILETRTAPNILSQRVEADFAVVGAGYSGLAAARRLAELKPDSTVALVDAGRIGNNAAGRSSGFAIDHAHNLRARSFADDPTSALASIRLNRAGLSWLDSLVSDNGIECGWARQGKYHAAATARGARMLEDFADSLDAIGEPYRRIAGTECNEVFGSTYYRRAIHAPHSYLVQPAALVRGLADTMPPNVTIYEDSAIVGAEFGPPHRLQTRAGMLQSPVVVLATNGFVAGFGFFGRHLIPLITWASMTRQLTDAEATALGGADSYGIIAAHPAGTSIRRISTPTNRLIVRSIFSFSRRSDFVSRKVWAANTHRKAFDRRWPDLAAVDFEYSWGGALSLSRNGQPAFGQLAPALYAACVHNGVGLARGTISGKLIAEHIAGEASPLVDQMLAKARPNRALPLQSIGVRFNARVRRLIAGREE